MREIQFFAHRVRLCVLALVMLLLNTLPIKTYAQTHSMWVGESFRCDATDDAFGLTTDISWSYSGGSLELSYTGYRCDVKIWRYFSGTAYVTCSWKYRLYSGDQWRPAKKTWAFDCIDNPVSIYPSELVLKVGQTANLTYAHKEENSYTSYANAYFYTSSSCVSVSKNGYVTALAEGTGYINVYSDISSVTPHCKVYVTNEDIAPTNISIVPESISLYMGENRTLGYKLAPEGAKTTVTWSSEDPEVASVNTGGTVEGKTAGKTIVYAITSNGLRASANVIVMPDVQSVEIDDVVLACSYSARLIPRITPSDMETTFSWSSSDSSIAVVDSKGTIYALSEGQAIITVRTKNGKTGKAVITVEKVDPNVHFGTIRNQYDAIHKLIIKALNK